MKKRIVRCSKAGGSPSATTVHAVEAGGFVFVTGQVANRVGTASATDFASGMEFGTAEQQTVQVMENVKAILEEAGTDFAHVVKRNVYMTHVGDFETIYAAMARYFPEPVASTGVVTGLLPASARVEVEIIAVIP